MFVCTDSATLFNTFAALCTQHRWCRVPGKTSSMAFQKPSPPSPTAISGAIFNPRRFTSTSNSRQLWALSRAPTWKPTSSFLPSGVAPISTSMDRALGTVTMPDDAVAAVRQLEILHGGKERPGLHLDSLRKQLPGAGSKDICQGIVDIVRLTKPDNTAILIHGVSLSLRGSGRLDTRLDTPPISYRHHPVSCLAPMDEVSSYERKCGRFTLVDEI